MQKQTDYNDADQRIMNIHYVLEFLLISNSKTKAAWPMVYSHFIK